MSAASQSLVPKRAIWTRRTNTAFGAPRVHVVDDYVDTADAINIVLAVCGSDADAFYEGHGAIAATAQRKPELVMLDI